MPLEQFNDILTPAEIKRCKKSQNAKKTWYSLNLHVFTSFIFQHELGLAADEGVRQLVENTDGEVCASEKTSAMKVAASKRADALHKKMSKLVCVQTQS